jgi:hypothetical protein
MCVWGPSFLAVFFKIFAAFGFIEIELELETHMAQNPVLRAKVYARALRASKNVKRAKWIVL